MPAAVGPVVYFASSDQEEFLSTVVNKINNASNKLLTYAELWSADECVWGAKLGLFRDFGDHHLDEKYILEGYRRFGGSVRNVLSFAKLLANENVAACNILTSHPLDTPSSGSIKSIVDL